MKKLTCHCGAVEAEVNVPEKFEKDEVQLFNMQKKRLCDVTSW